MRVSLIPWFFIKSMFVWNYSPLEPSSTFTTEGCFCPDGTKLFNKESGICVEKCGKCAVLSMVLPHSIYYVSYMVLQDCFFFDRMSWSWRNSSRGELHLLCTFTSNLCCLLASPSWVTGPVCSFSLTRGLSITAKTASVRSPQRLCHASLKCVRHHLWQPAPI